MLPVRARVPEPSFWREPPELLRLPPSVTDTPVSTLSR